MSASSMGAFGAYKWAYSRHQEGTLKQNKQTDPSETVWVTKRYVPTDLRSSAPVPRHKLLSTDVKSLPRPPVHWIPASESSLRAFYRDGEEEFIYVSQPSTRCEEWSTLRQMLPSRGGYYPSTPPNWGTGLSTPPVNLCDIHRRFPHLNSPMTRLVFKFILV